MDITCVGSGSSGNAYIVKTSKHLFLLEAGVKYSKIMNALKYRIPDAVLLSHCHGDHSSHINYFAQKGIPILCSDGTAKGEG